VLAGISGRRQAAGDAQGRRCAVHPGRHYPRSEECRQRQGSGARHLCCREGQAGWSRWCRERFSIRERAMTAHTYDKETTALLVIDPYNDFISEGGKLWGRIRAVAEANNCVPHMLQVLQAACKAKLRVFYAMHHRYRPGDYETWKVIGRFRSRRGGRKSSNTARGAASTAPGSSLSRARLSPPSTGVPAALPTPIWICSSRSTASGNSS
jgi:hypothetical protein